jgi:hypothetical protein
MVTTKNSALHSHEKQSTRWLGISANSTRIFLRGAKRFDHVHRCSQRNEIRGKQLAGCTTNDKERGGTRDAAYNHSSMECHRDDGEKGSDHG